MQLIWSAVWIFFANQVYRRIFPPRKLLLIHGDRSIEDILHKFASRKDKYTIVKCMGLEEGAEALFDEMEKGYGGVVLMLIFYLCRRHRAAGAALYVLDYLPALWGGSLEDPLALVVGGHPVNWTIFALLALPLIYLPTKSGLRTPKWFFYVFYPAHLAVIAAVRSLAGLS